MILFWPGLCQRKHAASSTKETLYSCPSPKHMWKISSIWKRLDIKSWTCPNLCLETFYLYHSVKLYIYTNTHTMRKIGWCYLFWKGLSQAVAWQKKKSIKWNVIWHMTSYHPTRPNYIHSDVLKLAWKNRLHIFCLSTCSWIRMLKIFFGSFSPFYWMYCGDTHRVTNYIVSRTQFYNTSSALYAIQHHTMLCVDLTRLSPIHPQLSLWYPHIMVPVHEFFSFSSLSNLSTLSPTPKSCQPVLYPWVCHYFAYEFILFIKFHISVKIYDTCLSLTGSKHSL